MFPFDGDSKPVISICISWNLPGGSWNSPNTNFVWRFIFDFWHWIHDFAHCLTSFLIFRHVNFEEINLTVNLIPGWGNLWNWWNIFMRKFLGKSDKKKKKRNTSINFNTNYRREMKLVPANMDYCLFQFDLLKFFF